jgi:aminoglycoside phosphotransferase family enzyme/predicted kinase
MTTSTARPATPVAQPDPTVVPAVADEVRETAISTVILTGDRVWKLRKPVSYPFLDQRSLGAQRRLCESEVRLNSRLAPDVYLGVVDVVDPATGAPRPATLMRRLPDDLCLSTLLREGTDVRPELREIARTMATFHLRADCGPRVAAAGTAIALSRRWGEVLSTLGRFTGTVLDRAIVDRVAGLAAEYIDGRNALFEHRVATDKIVDGHGDLLADDIFCLEDGPAILDCLEFNDELRCCDVVSDVASLAMECERLGHPELGEEFLREYASYTADSFPASLADHYVAYRAVVRCEVACLRHEQGALDAADQARQLLDIALRHLIRARVVWVLVGGPPGAGKSTIAAGLGDALGWTVLRSDRLRRELTVATWQGTSEWLSEHFSPGRRAGVYREIIRRAELLGGMGESVVMDATWSSADPRALAGAAARTARCALVALRCDVPAHVAEHRVAHRIAAGTDISMATVAVARQIAARFEPWPDAVIIGTGQPLADALSSAVTAIDTARPQARFEIREADHAHHGGDPEPPAREA